jgi:hypothetical protein
MIRASIITFLMLFAIGCDRSADKGKPISSPSGKNAGESEPAEAGGRHMRVIDYGHMRDGILYHGTLSDLDGSPKATWTYEDRGKKITRDQPIDKATFEKLWTSITSSEVFRRHRASAAGKQIDPVRSHVVGIAFEKQGKKGQDLFLVPADEGDAEFSRT